MGRCTWITAAVVFCFLVMVSSIAYAEENGLLLHLSFDGKITADFAKGDAKGFQKKPEHSVKYIDGVKGKAILLDNGSVHYKTKNNLSASEGTIALWMKPVAWDPAQPSKQWTSFFNVYQRIGGGGEDMIAFWRYPETMTGGYYQYFSEQGDNLGNYVFEIKDWEKGQWKSFAFTWDEKGFSKIFIDGKLFSSTTRKPETLPVDINELAIGASGTAYDEFRVFDRVLTDEEIKGYFVAAAPEALKTLTTTGSATYSSEGEITFPEGPATASASPIEGPIKIDGIIDEAAWENCVEFQDMSLSTGNQYPVNRTSFKLGYDKENLYIAVEVFNRAGKPKVKVRKHGGPVYTDDSIEIFIDPKRPDKKYYQFVANAVAARYEGCGMDGGWDGKWQAATTEGNKKWFLEVAIPFKSIAVSPLAGKVLGFNVTRNDKSANQSQTWADLAGFAFHRPDRFGRLVLARTPVGATGTSMICRKDGKVAASARLKNAGVTLAGVKWLIAGSAGGSSFRFEETAKIDSKKDKMVEKTGIASGIKGTAGWRSALWADGELLYLSPTRTADFLALPPLLEAREPLTLANRKVSLQFDAYSGAIISLKNLETGLELIPRHEPQPLFSLDAVSYQKHPMFFEEEDVMPLEASNDSARECRIEKRADGTQILTAVHIFKEGMTTVVTIELPPDSEISNWKIKVQNRLPRRPREAVIIHRVAFPQLGGLRAAEDDKKQALAWPQQAGRLVPEPARKASDLRKLESPGGASMTWADLSGPDGGLYLASHDIKPVVQTIFEAQGDPKRGELSLTIRRWSLTWPQETWEPASCSVGIHSNDWHWSADRYRSWFYANFNPRPTPQWVLDEDGWIMTGHRGRPGSTFQHIPDTLTAAQNMGINYIQSWHYHQLSVFKEMVGAYFPNVYCGTEEEFKEAIKTVHDNGGHIGFYLEAADMETRLGQLMHQPQYLQKIPPDIVEHMPGPDPVADGWLQAAIMDPDGSYRLGWPSGIDNWQGCVASEGWGDWYYYCIVEKHAKEYKTDAWYADILPWVAHGVCFNPKHKHSRPMPLGQAYTEFGERVVKNVSKDFGILAEGVCDRLLGFQTHSLRCHSVHLEDSEPALFLYTHPRHPHFSGTSCFPWGGPSVLYERLFGIKKTSFADHMRYILLYGMRFNIFRAPLFSDLKYLNSGEKEERDIIMLRRCVHEDLEACDFRDQIGLTGAAKNMESRVFVRSDLKGGLVTVVDYREKKEAITLHLDLALHGLHGPVTGELCLPGGRVEMLPKPAQEGSVARFSLPAREEKMFIIRFKTIR